jgi:primase-polymerase (primpol)-like protein
MNYWQHIPAELRERPQWAVAGPDKSPWTPQDYRASVDKPGTWAPFNQAARYASSRGFNVGYMLDASDPFCVIDLDWCNAESQVRKGKVIDKSKWSTPADAERYWRIVQGFDSYTERSTYGNGLHIFIKADIGEGCKPSKPPGIEVYSQARFIICTGDVIHDRPIAGRQELVTAMVADLREDAAPRKPLIEIQPTQPDEKIWQLARDAENGEKFRRLCSGDWKVYGFPSQSEADLALLSMFAFYSSSNDQCRHVPADSARKTRQGAEERQVSQLYAAANSQ